MKIAAYRPQNRGLFLERMVDKGEGQEDINNLKGILFALWDLTFVVVLLGDNSENFWSGRVVLASAFLSRMLPWILIHRRYPFMSS